MNDDNQNNQNPSEAPEQPAKWSNPPASNPNQSQTTPLDTSNPLANIPGASGNPISPSELNPSWLNPQQSTPPNQTPEPESPIPTFSQTPNVSSPNSDQANLTAVLNAPPPHSQAGQGNPPVTMPVSPSPNGPIPEPAPTDLSQLTGNNEQPPPPEIYTPAVANTENLIVPTAPAAGIPESFKTSQNHQGLSKFLIIGGILVLLVVTGLSAYFFLGIGKSNRTTPTTPTEVKQITPAPTQTSEASPSGSVGFGELNGGATPPPSATPLSAIERLKQRQASPSPTP